MRTPLGLAVLPEVQRTTARSEGDTSAPPALPTPPPAVPGPGAAVAGERKGGRGARVDQSHWANSPPSRSR